MLHQIAWNKGMVTLHYGSLLAFFGFFASKLRSFKVESILFGKHKHAPCVSFLYFTSYIKLGPGYTGSLLAFFASDPFSFNVFFL